MITWQVKKPTIMNYAGLMPPAGVGVKAGSALSVVDDRDFEELVAHALVAEQLPPREPLVVAVSDGDLRTP